MAKFNERLKELRQSSGLSQADLSKQLRISKSSINMYERGEREPGIEKLEAIADYFNVDLDYLTGKSDHKNKYSWLNAIDDKSLYESVPNIYPITTKKFPLLGNIACGEPIFASEDFELYVEAESDINADFCLHAKGDSMIGARIYDGDVVFIRRQPTVENGEIAAVLIDDEATLKRVQYDKEAGVLLLFPDNPMHRIQRYSGEELNQIRILGKAIAFQSVVK